ncbi:unnamed protein product [Closterium sp. NIES-54]
MRLGGFLSRQLFGRYHDSAFHQLASLQALPSLSRVALPEPHCPAPTEPHCPIAARAAIAGTTAVTALACALLPTYSTDLHGHFNSCYYCPFAAATDCHCLSWPLSWYSQQLRVDGNSHCLSRTRYPRSSSASGLFSEPRCVPGSVEAAALGASESAAALGASESVDAPGASESAAALGARASTATGPASAKALHTFTLDSGASRCFFRDCTTLTLLAAPVPVSLADPTGGPIIARASTVLPCPTVPSGSLLGLHLPEFLTNLLSNTVLQNAWVDTFIPRGQRVAICKCSRTGRHLATFTRQPGSELYTLTTASSQVSTSTCTPISLSLAFLGPCPPSCARLHCRAFPALRGGSAPLLTPPFYSNHYSSAHSPHGRIRATRRQLRERFRQDLPVLRLHSDRGREFSSGLFEEFCRDEGIRQTFTLPASPQQNGIAERHIGLIMEVACTSMIHAAAPHFLWLFAVKYAAHQLNHWPRVFEPEISPTLWWTGKVGDTSVFRVWGALSLVCDAKASKLSSRTIHCVFLGFPTDAPPWQFYHPRARYTCTRPPLGRTPLPPQGPAPSENPPGFPPRPSWPPPLPAAMDSGAETAGTEPGGAEIEGEGSGGAGSRGAVTEGVATGGADSGGATSPSGGGVVGDPAGGPRAGQPLRPDLLETLSPQAIRAWIVGRGRPGGGGYGRAGAGATSPGGTAGAGGAGGTAGGAGGATGAGGTRGAASAGGTRAASRGGAEGDARAGGAGATSPGGATGAGGARAAIPGGLAGAGGARAAGTGGACAAGVGGAKGVAGAGHAGAGGTRGTRGASPGSARTGGATYGTGGAGAGGARTRGAGAAAAGGAAGAGGGGGTAGGAAGAGGAGGTAGARGAGATGARGAAGAKGATGAVGAGGAGAVGAGGAGAAGTALSRSFFYQQPQSSQPMLDSVLRQVLSLPLSTGLTPPLLCPPTKQSQPQLLPGSPLPALAPHTEVTESLTERRETETRDSTHVCARHVARPHPPAVPCTHSMALRPSSVPQRVVLPESPASSLPHVPDPESNLACAFSPTVTRLLATVVTNPDFESIAAFALVTELVNFAARSRLDYVASLVTKSEFVCPSSVGGEPALSNDVLEDRQFELECLAATLPRFASMLLCPEGDPDALDIPTPRSYAEAIAGEYSSLWQTAMDVEMASLKSTGTYVNEVPPPWVNIVDGMWNFRVKRVPGSPPAGALHCSRLQ